MSDSWIQVKESKQQVMKLLARTNDLGKKERLKFLLMLLENKTTQLNQLAEAIGKTEKTVSRWIELYKQGGIEKLLQVNGRKNKKEKPKCLGPVTNLEEQVQPDWWRRIFNSLYLKTDADVVDDQLITRAEVDLFSEILNLSSEHKILDLCCGQGRHSIELARRGFQNVEGLDRSGYLIHRAKERAKKENLDVKFREGDARKLPYPPDTFDVVMILGNSFGYFEIMREDLRVLKEAFRVLQPWGKIIIDVADGEYLRENFQKRSWEWIDKKTFVCRERSFSLDKQSLISREVIVNVKRGVIADQFYAERLYTKESLTELLKTAGFSEITFHGQISSNSQRNQDLGMMSKRIIVTAVAKKEWTPIKKKAKQAIKNVAVILGDPSKSDHVKPGGNFDDDDLYTVNKLKEALRELKDYRFIYLDNHNTLLTDLLRLEHKINLVFNLCDEGYNNEPKKELHIPALLEISGILYTGAPPQCLAHCYDKSIVRGVAREMGIPVPSGMFIKPDENIFTLNLEFPVIVKPVFGDSGWGITQKSVAYNIQELANAMVELKEKFHYDKPILVEEFLTGPDLTVGMIGNPPDDYLVLPITQEDYSVLPPELPKICGYEAKWIPDSPYWKIKPIPANLPESTERFIIDCCLKLFKRLGVRDYCRFDWRLDSQGNPKLLEVNPNPGWCWDGHLAKAAAFASISYSKMLELILKSAEKRLKLL